MKFLSKYILSMLLLVVGGKVYAVPYKDCGGIGINGMFDYVYKDQKKNGLNLIKRLTNDACKTGYYKIHLIQVEDPFGDDSGRRLSLADMMQSKLLLTPQKLVIGPKKVGEVAFRLPEGNKEDQLQFYKIIFEPVTPSKELGFNMDKVSNEDVKAGATFTMSIASLVVVEPNHPNYAYEKSFKNQKLNFTNKGNALIFLELNGACKAQIDQPQESGVCLNGDGFTRLKVYPQQSIEIDVSNYQQSFKLSIVKADKRDFQRIELQS